MVIMSDALTFAWTEDRAAVERRLREGRPFATPQPISWTWMAPPRGLRLAWMQHQAVAASIRSQTAIIKARLEPQEEHDDEDEDRRSMFG